MKPVFIGHGSPMNAVDKNEYTRFLENYARSLTKPRAIVVISAHWETSGTYITAGEHPEQIYDFYGFPRRLFEVDYQPSGLPELAEQICNNIDGIQPDYNRGIDHAGWAVVKHMYPDKSVPLLEVSLDRNKTPREHYETGKKLISAIDEDVLVIGSGNMVHNLRDITFHEEDGNFPWAVEADEWLKGKLINNDIDALVDYKDHFPDYRRAIPTEEHYLPLLYILGMKEKGINIIYEEIQNGSISMTSLEVD